MIQALQALGLTLEEIDSIIDLFFEEPTILRGKQKLVEILQIHLKETDEKIEALMKFRSELQANITRLQQYIEGCDRNRIAKDKCAHVLARMLQRISWISRSF